MRAIWLGLAAAELAGGVLYGAVGGRAGDGGAARTISGRVLDEEGRPAAGVFVTVRAPGSPMSHTRVTDPGGGYAFPPLAPGTYELTAHRADVAQTVDTVRVVDGSAVSAELRVDADAVAPG